MNTHTHSVTTTTWTIETSTHPHSPCRHGAGGLWRGALRLWRSALPWPRCQSILPRVNKLRRLLHFGHRSHKSLQLVFIASFLQLLDRRPACRLSEGMVVVPLVPHTHHSLSPPGNNSCCFWASLGTLLHRRRCLFMIFTSSYRYATAGRVSWLDRVPLCMHEKARHESNTHVLLTVRTSKLWSFLSTEWLASCVTKRKAKSGREGEWGQGGEKR